MKKSLFLLLIIYLIHLDNKVIYAHNTVSNIINPVTYFVNHVSELTAITTNLQKYSQVSLIGTSGMGKTQLARTYAYTNKNLYNIIWCFDCNLEINQQFVKLAKEINKAFGSNISEDYKLATKEVLLYLQLKKDWLLIFDNLKVRDNNKVQEFINWEHNGHIIFCSQDSSALPNVVTTTKFKEKDAATLVNILLEEENYNYAKFIIEEFKGYPLLLVQGALIFNNIKGLNNVEYKKMLQESNNKIKLNTELCIKELTPSAKILLKKISLINNQSFSKSFLKMMTENNENLEDDIYQLLKYALISNTDSNEENPLFEMHDTISKTVQNINSYNENTKYLEEIIFSVLVKSFPRGVVAKQAVRLTPTFNDNLEVILKNIEKFNINIFANLKLREELLLASLNSRKYNLSETMIKWFEDKEHNNDFNVSKMNDYEKCIYASYLNAIGGYNNFALSSPIKAIEYFTKAKEIILSIDNYENIKFNILYQVLRTQIDLGQLVKAELTIEEILQVYETGIKNNGIEPFDRSFFHLAKARLFLAKTKYNEAINEIDGAISTFKEFGLKDTNMLLESSYQLKIEALNSLHKYNDAYSLAHWLYEVYKPSLNHEHEIFANIYTKIAVAEYGLGKYKESLESANKAINMFVNVRKIDITQIQLTKDIQLAKSLVIKADSLSALGDFNSALEIYETAEAIHNNVYGEHLDSSISLRHLLFEATKTSCKTKSKSNTFWYNHFYSKLKSIFGMNIPEIKEIELICLTKML